MVFLKNSLKGNCVRHKANSENVIKIPYKILKNVLKNFCVYFS